MRIGFAVDAGIAGAQIAAGIMGEGGGVVGGFLLALPRALGAVGGNQNPLVCQWVVAAVRVFGGIKSNHGGLQNVVGCKRLWRCKEQ